ncbi:mannose-6-phosphate isomerase, class I [Aquibacillus rhizosphaerae]|uniref:Mannose-6-phosphate isomerase n=1 Tax=Aquibacillus rhizosphaerae TaxID=3051431 RepID=A0ABT7L528_9BACI|nr:mannose-6-phosphate isomerase, class I [Aquibacillus sp. LR5S19]MDL4840961.1 mannose-6-phosphate isomerase, class I [Aquibacillus sp. LR5S19]
MYNEPIFLEPVFKERIWGGQKLKQQFGYNIPYERTGEAWVISAHPNGPSIITNGALKNKTLADAWNDHGELFNRTSNTGEAFPLLVKILDAADDLSVQVHPDDTYAREVESQPYGKTECWYVLSAEKDAEIIFGHHANSKEEFKQMVSNGDWDSLLRRVKVKTGDFVYVPSGTIHAIGKGIVILETQQSSDITYRVYDYDRKDVEGNGRELHLDSAIDVSNVPHETMDIAQTEEVKQGLLSKKLVQETYFTVFHWQLKGEVTQQLNSDFLQISVVSGSAHITIHDKSFPIKKGEHFILPASIKEFKLTGDAEFIVSHP